MRILLSRMFSLALCGAALLFASSAMATPITYPMTGSTMSQDNTAAGGACTHATCNVAVTGNLTLDDDGLGNVTLTQVNLAHPSYQVGPGLPVLSVIITRNAITLGAGSVAGTGSTIGESCRSRDVVRADRLHVCAPRFLPVRGQRGCPWQSRR